MNTRKNAKRAARKVLKRHYLFFVLLCLIAVYLRTEFSSSLPAAAMDRSQSVAESTENEADTMSTGVVAKHSLKLSDVLMDFCMGNEEETTRESEEIRKSEVENTKKGAVLGRSRGVFAAVLNSITSGSIYLLLLSAVNSIVKSKSIVVILLVILAFVVVFAIWFFFENVFSVIMRRVFLEGRTYEKVSFQRTLFLLRVKRWTRACCTMALKSLFSILWSLTVVGGMIKFFSYYLVPYIVAENPDIKPLEAISLSRRMMKGHKWECFRWELSFFGWTMLSSVTFGVTGIFYSNPYKAAVFSEYYAALREEAKKKGIKGSEYLNDTYLFAKASKEQLVDAYGDVFVAEHLDTKNVLKLKGIFRILADWFGILFTNNPREQEYEKARAAKVLAASLKEAAEGRAYPGRLSAIPETQKRKRVETVNYLRHYSIWSLVAMFFIFSFIGWTWEVSLHLISDGKFVNRGVLFGPWLPIYGAGGILILVILNRLRQWPAVEFAATVILCGTVEYSTSVYLEWAHDGQKWWDYSGYFLNINGRVCAEGLLVFGLGGVAIVYLLAPMLDNLLQKASQKVLIPVCLILLVLYGSDSIYSSKHPNMGDGITNYEARTEIDGTWRYTEERGVLL